MRKRNARNRRKRFYPRSLLILALTLLYGALFVVPLFLSNYATLGQAPLGHELFDAFSTFVQVFCILFALTFIRLSWWLLWPALVLATVLDDYMVSTFHAQVSKDSVAVLFEATPREIDTFLTPPLLVALMLGVVLSTFGIVLLKRERPQSQNRRAAFLALLFTLALVGSNGGSMSTSYPPYNFLTASYQYGSERFWRQMMPRRDISDVPAYWQSGSSKPFVIAVVIGESSRADHWSLDGYARETNPLLAQRANLVNFPQVTSCGVFTNVAVPCLLTRATEKDKGPITQETSLISVFKKLGFDTLWLGAQGKFSAADPTTAVSGEAGHRILVEERRFMDNSVKDEQLLPFLDEALSHQAKPLLVVLHTYGSHWQYGARYPKAFERYTPTCPLMLLRDYTISGQVAEIHDCAHDPQMLVNSYDNSILYTDYIIDQVIHRLEDKDALVLYTADHGESLGEGGRYLHGYEDAPENRHVPLLWWASDEFIATHGDAWQTLSSKNALPINHDVVFHSLLDCAGVSSALIDTHLSLCHTTETPHD